MTINKQINLRWNWQLSSSPEQLWQYVADTNRLFKDLNLPAVRPTDIPHHPKKTSLQFLYSSIKYTDVWIEEPLEWEYPYRYVVKRIYKNGPYKEVKIQVDLLPNPKGTRLHYQLQALPNHFLKAAISTFKHKTIQRTRLKNVFKYYDELAERNCLPYEAQLKKSRVDNKKNLREFRNNLMDATNLKGTTDRLAAFIHRTRRHPRLKKLFKFLNKISEWSLRLYQAARIGKIHIRRSFNKLTYLKKVLTINLRKAAARSATVIRMSLAYRRLEQAIVQCSELIVKSWRWVQLKMKPIRRGIKRLNVNRKIPIHAIDLQGSADQLAGFTRRIMRYVRLKKFITDCIKVVKWNCLLYQAQFEKWLNDTKEFMINAVDDLNGIVEQQVDSAKRALHHSSLEKGFRYVNKFVNKVRRLLNRGWLQMKALSGEFKKFNELTNTITNAVDLKGIANRLASLIRRAVGHPLLHKVIQSYDSFIGWVYRQYQARFNRKHLRRGIKKLNGYGGALAADLRKIAERLTAFTRQTVPDAATYCGKLIEKYYRLYRIRFKRNRNKKLNHIREVLITATGRKNIVDRLLEFIQRADDIDLIRIEPYQLADYWQLERKNVLFVFLHATRAGLLNFNWDLYCPSCRTVQQTCKTLTEVHEPVFCRGCSENFTVNFNESIQLSFRPNPLIRKTRDSKYCSVNPRNTPHIAIQQYLKASQKRYLKTHLEEGLYHLRIRGSEGRASIMVDDDGQDTINIRLSACGLKGEEITICREPNLIFENCTQKEQTFILEKASWQDVGVTAAQVTSLQTFRDLFPHELLPKGEKIAVDKLTLMFTDLIDSTAMYYKEGDNQAVGRVIEHFEILQEAVTKENGALVKTIGDSVMAVFSDPVHAFRAFLAAQKTLELDNRFAKSLKLKAGIHHGRCVAVNLNNRIDYFGSTVNIASRLVDLANENEVILSEDVSKNAWFQQLLADNDSQFTIEPEHANLKGYDTEIFTINRIRFEKSLLRLAI